jgi:hypothetical protein
MPPPCWHPTPLMLANQKHWFVRETHGHAAPHAGASGRVVAQPVRIDRSRARASLARWPSWLSAPTGPTMLVLPDDAGQGPQADAASEINFGSYPMVNGQSRLAAPLL